MDQVVQVLGSLLILAAFLAAQRGWLSTTARPYQVLNLVGAAILAVLAAEERQVGFLLLESCWALVAGCSLLASRRSSRRHGGGCGDGASRRLAQARLRLCRYLAGER